MDSENEKHPGAPPSDADRSASYVPSQDRRLDAASSVSSSEHLKQPFDLEKTLRQAVQIRETSQISNRTLGVSFRNLHVTGLGATPSQSYQPTFGSIVGNPFGTILDAIQSARHPSIKTILTGFEGVVKPGEMLLVLGNPGSGCTSLLKSLAGSTHHASFHSVAPDSILYAPSFSPLTHSAQFRGDIQYSPEDDVHFPTLSVEQTVGFAATMRAPATVDRVQLGGKVTRGAYREMVTEVLLRTFGLTTARGTPVGDAAVRGVSGGEKKRVSIAEMLAMRGCLNLWDNSTRGLDSSTALEFIRALRTSTDILQTTTIMSLYQASDLLYEHFDKVCVVYEGRMAYFGKASEAKQYFLDMGYEPVNRQTTPDFLVAVTDPNARIPRSRSTFTPTHPIPRTADEFAQYFLNSKQGKENRAEIDAYERKYRGGSGDGEKGTEEAEEEKRRYIESAREEHDKYARKASPYILSLPQQISEVMVRRVQIIRGDMRMTYIMFGSLIFQGIIMGSVFLRSSESTSAYFSRGGVIFFSLLFTALAALAEIPTLFAQRAIVLRHRHGALYHPFVDALALTLVDIPISFVGLVGFSLILYFMVGLQKSADQFMVFFLFLFVLNITMKGWFHAVTAMFKTIEAAEAFAGFSVLVLAIYTGYMIPKPTMIGALRWLTYINPVRYGFESLLSNEFRTLKGACSTLVPQGPGYENITIENQVCATVGSVPGQDFVDGNRFVALSYDYHWSNTWMNLGIIIGFLVLFFAALLTFTEFNTVSSRTGAMVKYKRGSILKSSSSSTSSSHSNDEEQDKAAAVDTIVASPSRNISEIASGIQRKDTRVSKSTTRTRIDTPDVFSWQNINYTIPVDDGHRQLLEDVSGFVAPGKLTALMGESGAGKTTLLNVLAERTSIGVVRGDRFVNGQELPIDFQAQSGYCQQTDTHVPLATVREALLFSARLRQPRSVSDKEKEEWVDKCLEMCGLEPYASAMVGTLSIEHRKRTTIAVELAAKPRLLLFLDEPTTGLDSRSAWAIVSFLRSLADRGQAILCTIHQPSAELFQLFDKLLLLRKGGQTVYFGDLGTDATTVIQYFERNGGRPCLEGENPAEYALDVIGAGATATSALDWYSIWTSSPEAARLQTDLDRIHTEGRKRPPVEAALRSEFATGWLYQARQLIVRNGRSHWRDVVYLAAKLGLNIVGGLFIGFTFFQSKDSQQGTQNKLFAIFMATILGIPLVEQLQAPFIHTREIYEIRERPSRMYSWTALLTSQILTELPWDILGGSLFFFCFYWTVGFDSSRAGFTFLLLAIVYPTYYVTFGQAIAALSPNPEIASILFSTFYTFVVTFNGVLQPFGQLGWWKWMYRISPLTYLIEAALGQAIGRQEINCSPVEFATINPPSGFTCEQYMGPFMSHVGGYLTNPLATSECQFCSIRTTDEFLRLSFNIFYDNHWRDFGIVMGFIAFNVLLVFTITYFFRIRTKSIFSFLRRKKN